MGGYRRSQKRKRMYSKTAIILCCFAVINVCLASSFLEGVSYNESKGTCPKVCFKSLPKTHSYNGIKLECVSSSTTCRDVCKRIPDCWGADYNYKLKACYIHLGGLENQLPQVHHNDVTQFRRYK